MFLDRLTSLFFFFFFLFTVSHRRKEGRRKENPSSSSSDHQMTRQIIWRSQSSSSSSSAISRRQPLLNNKSEKGNRIAEIAGATTAECAAVCCCCPCGLVNLLVLAVYKLPAGLCKKALKMKRKHSLKAAGASGLFPQRRGCTCGCVQTDLQIHPFSVEMEMIPEKTDTTLTDKELMDLETEMWDKFYSTGFWRSPSQREELQETEESEEEDEEQEKEKESHHL